jgi:ubiquinone biosynthesis protein
MSILYDTLKLLQLISKYRILDTTVKANSSLLSYALYNLCIIIFYPPNIFLSTRPLKGDQVIQVCKSLGPIYVKFAQAISTRPDVFGEKACALLQTVQDKLNPFAFEIVAETIRKELGRNLEEIFADFDPVSFAAASVAQVHKARLHSGQSVAVKVLRPKIKERYAKDLKTLRFIAKILLFLLPTWQKFKIQEILSVFNDTMLLELNLKIEAAHCSELQANCAKDTNIYIPYVYWALTTESILVSQWVEGISIYDIEKINSAGLDAAALSRQVAVMFFNQTYRDGFFHADLHPGNIFLTYDGKIALVDFGIMGRLSQQDRLTVAQILHALLNRNYMRVAQLHAAAGYIPKTTDLSLFALHCRAICEPIVGLALKDVSINNILGQLFAVIQKFGLEIQPQLIMLQKSMIIIEGIGKILDPNINMWHIAAPWMEKWATKNLTIEAKLYKLLKRFKESSFYSQFDII